MHEFRVVDEYEKFRRFDIGLRHKVDFELSAFMRRRRIYGNGIEYELIQPIKGPNIYWDHLNRFGSGMHHFKIVIRDDEELAAYVKELEAKGLIRQYTVVLDEKKLGNDLTVFVSVRLENPRCGEAFARAASAHPNISECYYIAGDVDYLLKIVTDSSRSLELIHEDIKAMEGVAWTKTLYVLSTIKNDVSVLPGEV